MSKKELGQFFTVSEHLQQFVFDSVKYKNELLLEPSFGAGHLLKKFKEFNNEYPIHCYEIDKKIKPILEFNKYQEIIYKDFTKQKISIKYKTIIGNPPYVKQRSKRNLYIEFIDLCFQLLDENGELIFIVPSDFLKLTSSSSLIEKMTKEGSFTDFLFPNDETLFEEASVDIVVFRYEKGFFTKTVKVNKEEKFCNIQNGIVTFSNEEMKGSSFSDIFDVYVGIVSGKDEVYKNKLGNIEVLTDKDKQEKFILLEDFPSKDEKINSYLESKKELLLSRKIRKFNEKNWFEWGALRNSKTIKENLDKPCIYLRNMTRKKEVAFTGKVQYFGGSLLCLIPKKDVDLEKYVKFLNTEECQRDYIYSGRFKIGHKQICSAIWKD
jgi:adenine-specific DNA-methyltransferase